MTIQRKSVEKYVQENVDKIRDQLQSFAKNAAVFSSDDPRLIDEHKEKWVGVYHGNIVACENTFGKLKNEIIEAGIPLSETMIQRIDRDTRTLIL